MFVDEPVDGKRQAQNGRYDPQKKYCQKFPVDVFPKSFDTFGFETLKIFKVDRVDGLNEFFVNSHYQGNCSPRDPWHQIGSAHGHSLEE